MTEKLNSRDNYKTDTSAFGGIIEIEDFSTIIPNRKRIGNQIAAYNISHQRKERQKYQHMTLEEFREIRVVSNGNGRPGYNLTDEKWQREFSVRKMFITPYSKNITRLASKNSVESGKWNEETQGTYHGKTSWQEYCSFINDVLNNIRAGQTDYCYFIYQIMELAKFHYDDLETKYKDGYWEVWLNRRK